MYLDIVFQQHEHKYVMFFFFFFHTLQNGPVQSWPTNPGQMFLSPWQQGAAAIAQQPVIPEAQPLTETWR